ARCHLLVWKPRLVILLWQSSPAGGSSKRQRTISSPGAKEQCGGSKTTAPHKPVNAYDLHTLWSEATVLPGGRLHNVIIIRQWPQQKGGVLLTACQARHDQPRQQAVRPSRVREAPVIW
ncbi:unnamed protein product, partial [Ectocarpus sp. 6 AP-2014]